MGQQEDSVTNTTTSVAPPPAPVSSPVIKPFASTPSSRGRTVLWVVIGVALIVSAIAYFAHMMIGGYRQSSDLVAKLHDQMTQRQWNNIYEQASAQYKDSITVEQNAQLFSAIDRKLGSPLSTKQQSLFVNSNSGVTTIRVTYETVFSRDATGTEEITWISRGGQFRLASYDIHSTAWITR